MDNKYITAQCRQMLRSIDAFKQTLEMAALEDDGVISKEEAKVIKRLNKAADALAREIGKVCE